MTATGTGTASANDTVGYDTKKSNWDGNPVVGMKDEEIAALTLLTRWGKSLNVLWTSGSIMSMTRWWQAIGQRAMEAVA